MAEDNDERQEQEAGEATPPAALVIDPRDEEIKSMKMNLHVMSQSLETTNQLLQSVLQGRGQQQQQPVKAKRGPITEEEMEEAFQNGKGAAKLREYMGQMAEELVETHIAPLRQTGLSAIGDTVMEVLKPKMPYFDRFSKEIQVFLDAYPPDLRVNARAIKAAYDTVVGSHLDELADERAEQKVRQATAPVVTPKSTGRVRGREDEVMDAEELSPGALRGVGRTEEELARRLGYKSWAEYQKINPEEVGQ